MKTLIGFVFLLLSSPALSQVSISTPSSCLNGFNSQYISYVVKQRVTGYIEVFFTYSYAPDFYNKPPPLDFKLFLSNGGEIAAPFDYLELQADYGTRKDYRLYLPYLWGGGFVELKIGHELAACGQHGAEMIVLDGQGYRAASYQGAQK